MQLSILSITMPPRIPGICTKLLHHPGAFESKFLPGRRGFVGVGPEGRAFVCKRFLPFWEFSL